MNGDAAENVGAVAKGDVDDLHSTKALVGKTVDFVAAVCE